MFAYRRGHVRCEREEWSEQVDGEVERVDGRKREAVSERGNEIRGIERGKEEEIKEKRGRGEEKNGQQMKDKIRKTVEMKKNDRK